MSLKITDPQFIRKSVQELKEALLRLYDHAMETYKSQRRNYMIE